MCGRFTLRTPTPVLIEHFGLGKIPALPPRFNVAPTQDVLIVRAAETGAQREGVLVRWGLIPSWADDPAIGNRLINARAESVATKPAYRHAFRRRRCLVVADGFFEWRKVGKQKQPYYLRRADEAPFAFAGLWESWQPDASLPAVESATIITTDSNALVRPIHDRMPAILSPNDYDAWLNPALQDPSVLLPLLGPFEGDLKADPVSTRVNSPKFDDPECIESP